MTQPGLRPIVLDVVVAVDEAEDLIGGWQELHREEIDQGHTGPPALEKKGATWSRHVSAVQVGKSAAVERALSDGTLVYALLDVENGEPVGVERLYPVMIGRDTWDLSPQELVEASNPALLPAKGMPELSPADRVFGWVNPAGGGGHKGQLRVGRVRCVNPEDAVEVFPSPGVPLAILGQPQPAQSRFYLGRSADGIPYEKGVRKEAMSAQGDSIRGRKVYPHHAGAPETAEYWANPAKGGAPERVGGWCKEFRAPSGVDAQGKNWERTNQNRSMLGWVKPGAVFECDIDVENLSDAELGALLWVLSDGGHLRLGGAKPLGFGSMTASVVNEESWVASGSVLRGALERLDGDPAVGGLPEGDSARLVAEFSQAVEAAYPQFDSFAETPFIAAWRVASRGFADKKPVHYPRVKVGSEPQLPGPDTKLYEWFAQNERIRGGGIANGFALPPLKDDRGLPYLER